MVLVINPVLQYTIFEQLKNILIRRRTAILRAASKKSKVVAVLSDVDYFFLVALAKLGVYRFSYDSVLLHNERAGENRGGVPLRVPSAGERDVYCAVYMEL